LWKILARMKQLARRVSTKTPTARRSRSSRNRGETMAENAPKSRRERREADEREQSRTTNKQADKIKDDGFDPDPEVGRAVGGDRAAKDTKSDPPAKSGK
jgi:hypothetical protein